MPLDRRAECRAELFPLSLDLPEEDPIASAAAAEVTRFYPASGLGWVTPFSPAPEGVKECAVDGAEGALTDDVPVVLCPAANEWVEDLGELASWGLAMAPDKAPHLREKCCDVLLCRCDQQLAVVFPYVLAEEVEAIVDMGNVGLLDRQLQPTLVEECGDERFDLGFQQFLRAAGHDEVISKTNEIHFGTCSGAGVFGIAVVQQAFQTVQGEVGKGRRDWATLRCSFRGGGK